jgi:MoaA/NifB/PqqE/SkfB family radical SAM enzyme
MKFTNQMKAFGFNQAMKYLEKDPEANIPKLMELADRFMPKDQFPEQRAAFHKAIDEKNNWYELIMKVYDLDPGVRTAFFKNFILNENIFGWPVQEKNREKYGCNIPWAILLDPTSACNLHCTGCWSAEYGNKLSLSYETIDSIISQGKELGVYLYIYTGGEPLVRRKDVITLCKKHSDCTFLCFTNATLIDRYFCREMLRVKNFIPAISVEGFEEATDARRGKGTYSAVVKAMELLKEHSLPFGISCCCTSANTEAICSEQFFDQMVEWGALFCWFFTFMPVGVGTPVGLIPSAAQREHLFHFVRDMRSKKPLFTMDFWGDSEYVGGCIAGGRRYLHINAAGDVEPCVFIHYSNANIHETSLLDALRSPIFMEYHNNQPFNGNLLRPCPVLDNPGRLAEMVKKAKAESTDLQHKEDAGDLCAKCVPTAEAWAHVADRLWTESRPRDAGKAG